MSSERRAAASVQSVLGVARLPRVPLEAREWQPLPDRRARADARGARTPARLDAEPRATLRGTGALAPRQSEHPGPGVGEHERSRRLGAAARAHEPAQDVQPPAPRAPESQHALLLVAEQWARQLSLGEQLRARGGHVPRGPRVHRLALLWQDARARHASRHLVQAAPPRPPLLAGHTSAQFDAHKFAH